MEDPGNADGIVRLRVAITDLLAQADRLEMLEVGIHLEQARLATLRAEGAAGGPRLIVVARDGATDARALEPASPSR